MTYSSQSEFRAGLLKLCPSSGLMRLSLGSQNLVSKVFYDEKTPWKKNKYWELVFAYKNLKNIAFWVKIVAENS